MNKRPNVVIIFADQLRADALGCYGNQVCRTPNIDALAARGTAFPNAFTPNPVCVPARASITTGNYPHVCTGNKDNSGRIRDDQPKLAEHFVRNGYGAFACGKLHYDPYSPPGEPRLTHGFQAWDSAESGRILAQFDPRGRTRGLEDYFDYLEDVGWKGYSRAHGIGNNDVRPCPSPLPAEHHVDRWVADRTIARIADHQRNAGNKPFLAWCGFPKPHSPYDPPWDYARMYDPRKVPPPAGDETLLHDRNPRFDRERSTRTMATLSPEARQVIKAYYYGLISHQDEQVGRIIAELKRLGILQDTIVVYSADHGDLMGDFGTWFKANFMQGSVRVPLIFAGPGIPDGGKPKQLVGLQDVLPTLASMAGIPLEQTVQGVDLTRQIAGEDAPTRDLYYSSYGKNPRQSAMVCDGRWKYCYAQEGAVEELYDLSKDPQELVNLASGARHDMLSTWRSRLIAEARKLGDDRMLDGDALAASPVDREAIRKLPVTGMGWRWY